MTTFRTVLVRSGARNVGIDVPEGASGVPIALVVPGKAKPVSRPDPAHVVGTVDLYDAAAAFSGKLPFTLGIDPHTKATAPVRFAIVDGTLTGWRLPLADQLRHVIQGHGRSGNNRDYVLSTVKSIEAQGFRDSQLHQLALMLHDTAHPLHAPEAEA